MSVIQMTGHPTVDRIGQMSFEGNVIPHTWYENIRYENKRGSYCDYLAVLVLAELVYWHRPTPTFDEYGRQTGWKKKFASDKLRKSYRELREKLGATDNQMRSSVKLLKDLGLIEIELRDEVTSSGFKCVNVTYFDIDCDKLSEFTFCLVPRKPSQELEDPDELVESRSEENLEEIIDHELSAIALEEEINIPPVQSIKPIEISPILISPVLTPMEVVGVPQQQTPEIQPRERHIPSAAKCDAKFAPLPEWRNSTRRNDYKEDVVKFLEKEYLPARTYYQNKGGVSRGDVITWLVKREFEQEGLGQIEAMLLDYHASRRKAEVAVVIERERVEKQKKEEEANASVVVNGVPKGMIPFWVVSPKWPEQKRRYEEYVKNGRDAAKCSFINGTDQLIEDFPKWLQWMKNRFSNIMTEIDTKYESLQTT